jgi:integrase
MPRRQRKTPWLDWRNGIAYIKWYNPSKRRVDGISLRTSDPAEAETAFAEFLLHGKDLRDARPGRLTVEQALCDYLEEHAKPECADYNRQRDCSRHLITFFKDVALEDIDITRSEDYRDARRSGRVGGGKRRANKRGADSTIRRELNVLHSAAQHALQRKRISTMPVIKMPKDRRAHEDEEAPYYTLAEVKAIFAAADDIGGDMPSFVRLLYYTGARRRSIEHLTRDQVKWPARRILLQKPGKRATKKRQPIVPILKSMEAPLRAVWDLSDNDRLFELADYYRHYVAVCEAAGTHGHGGA